MRQLYRRAISYASKLSHTLGRDYVHNAFIHFFTLTGENLFERDMPLILRFIKIAHLREVQRNWRRDVGEPREFFTVDEDIEIHYHGPSPLDQLITKDELSHIHDAVLNYRTVHKSSEKWAQNLYNVLLLLERGYTRAETAKVLGISSAVLHDHIKKIRQLLSITNPFVGSKVKLSKRISLKQYESTYKDYVYDPERDCDENEYFRIVVHKDKDDYLLIRLPALSSEVPNL